MRNTCLLIILLFSFTSYAQSLKSTRITQAGSVKLIESIESLEIFKGQQLYVSILKTSNGSGSANLPESDEVSFNLLICVAQYDEYPESKLFSVGPFLDPKVIKKVDSGRSVTLVVEDGLAKKRKTSKMIVSQTEVQIQ